MSPEAQRVAIAEACGWKYVHLNGCMDFAMVAPGESWHLSTYSDGGRWIDGKPSKDAKISSVGMPPDYLNSIDAMQSALQMQTVGHCIYFDRGLSNIAKEGSTLVSLLPASTWAECFLKTIGKWEDGE